jgi:hypothetical protein
MIVGENNYTLDTDENRVLIGLTVEETREFLALIELLAITNPEPVSPIDWDGPRERRWLVLMQKHTEGLEQFLRAGLLPKH